MVPERPTGSSEDAATRGGDLEAVGEGKTVIKVECMEKNVIKKKPSILPLNAEK